MTMKGHAGRWVAASAAVVLAAAGCGSKGAVTGANVLGNGAIQSVDVVARTGSFQHPLDAAPSPDGNVAYFVASAAGGAGVFRVRANGGAVDTLAQGAPLATPRGLAVASDGQHVYVADSTADGTGAILSVTSTPGHGAPVVVDGTRGYAPRGIDVVNHGTTDAVYFIGTDPANGAPGVFTIPAAGGSVSTIAEGTPFKALDSVVVAAKGTVYVTDQGSGSGHGEVFRVKGGTATQLLGNLHLGSPAGLTLADQDGVLLISSQNPTDGSDQLLFLDLATGKTAAANKGIGTNHDSSGGLHSAANGTDAAWADTRATVIIIHYPPITVS